MSLRGSESSSRLYLSSRGVLGYHHVITVSGPDTDATRGIGDPHFSDGPESFFTQPTTDTLTKPAKSATAAPEAATATVSAARATETKTSTVWFSASAVPPPLTISTAYWKYSSRLYQSSTDMQQIQLHTQRAQRAQRADPGAASTLQALVNVEVKTNQVRPLRIGLDSNLRRGVYFTRSRL